MLALIVPWTWQRFNVLCLDINIHALAVSHDYMHWAVMFAGSPVERWKSRQCIITCVGGAWSEPRTCSAGWTSGMLVQPQCWLDKSDACTATTCNKHSVFTVQDNYSGTLLQPEFLKDCTSVTDWIRKHS